MPPIPANKPTTVCTIRARLSVTSRSEATRSGPDSQHLTTSDDLHPGPLYLVACRPHHTPDVGPPTRQEILRKGGPSVAGVIRFPSTGSWVML